MALRMLLLPALALGLSCLPSPAPLPQEQDAAEAGRVDRLVGDLGSGDPGTRQRAEEDLGRLGLAAEKALRRLQTSPDAEVRGRAARALERIARMYDPPVAFRSPEQLSSLNILEREGATPSTLVRPQECGEVINRPAWSRDAKQIAFYAHEGIYRVNRDGSDLQRLSEQQVREECTFGWSPDGKFISFVSDRAKAANGELEGTPFQVFLLEVAVGKLARLTDGKYDNLDPCWAPDGKRIAYSEGRKDKDRTLFDLVTTDTGGQTRVRLTADGWPKRNLSWSPDGRAIAYAWEEGGKLGKLAVLDLAMKNVRRLTSEETLEEEAPVWSPDGKRIAFRRGHEASDLFVVDSDGKNEIRLTRTGKVRGLPGWTPAGAAIVFAMTVDGHCEIHSVKPDGAGLRRLTRTPQGAADPSVEPDR